MVVVAFATHRTTVLYWTDYRLKTPFFDTKHVHLRIVSDVGDVVPSCKIEINQYTSRHLRNSLPRSVKICAWREHYFRLSAWRLRAEGQFPSRLI